MITSSIELSPFRCTPFDTQKIFQSEIFKTSYAFITGGDIEYELLTPANKDVHIVSMAITAESSVTTFLLVENGVTVDGSTVGIEAIYNVDRTSATTNGSRFLRFPTTGAGTILMSSVLIKSDPWVNDWPEFILPRNTKYILKYARVGAQSARVTTSLVWYESDA